MRLMKYSNAIRLVLLKVKKEFLIQAKYAAEVRRT